MILAKRLSEKEKEEIVKFFTIGKNIDQLSKDFNCTKLTITRNLKRSLGEKKYKKLFESHKSSSKLKEDIHENAFSESNN